MMVVLLNDHHIVNRDKFQLARSGFSKIRPGVDLSSAGSFSDGWIFRIEAASFRWDERADVAHDDVADLIQFFTAWALAIRAGEGSKWLAKLKAYMHLLSAAYLGDKADQTINAHWQDLGAGAIG
ncbi:hypothetical protein SDC9_117323 [bioreactor metagenome]|uniref:Uncharacterized protein n=1 Tax=bioreactor metagenome TaxID=1076179 RepID=A0A645BZ40_9ZZZZ